MHEVGTKVKLHKGGMCSKHKSQEGVIVRVKGEGPRASYFIEFEDGQVEIQRSKHFDVIPR